MMHSLMVLEVLNIVEQGFKRGQYLYVGMFNDKPIAAVACFDDGQTNAKRLQYLTVHPKIVNAPSTLSSLNWSMMRSQKRRT